MIVPVLRGEDVRLRGRVGGVIGVAVEVIGCHVGQDADLGAERPHRLELERGDFESVER